MKKAIYEKKKDIKKNKKNEIRKKLKMRESEMYL